MNYSEARDSGAKHADISGDSRVRTGIAYLLLPTRLVLSLWALCGYKSEKCSIDYASASVSVDMEKNKLTNAPNGSGMTNGAGPLRNTWTPDINFAVLTEVGEIPLMPLIQL